MISITSISSLTVTFFHVVRVFRLRRNKFHHISMCLAVDVGVSIPLFLAVWNDRLVLYTFQTRIVMFSILLRLHGSGKRTIGRQKERVEDEEAQPGRLDASRIATCFAYRTSPTFFSFFPSCTGVWNAGNASCSAACLVESPGILLFLIAPSWCWSPSLT